LVNRSIVYLIPTCYPTIRLHLSRFSALFESGQL
jgi:hypothetical protein